MVERKPFPTQAPAIHWVWLLRVMKGATAEEVATLYGVQVSTVRGAVGYLGAPLERPTIIPAIPIGTTLSTGGTKRVPLKPGSRVVSRSGIRYLRGGG